MSGINSDTKLMLHFDGEDEATETTDSSPSSHSISFGGSAQLDTTYKKWGSAGLLLGTTDYIAAPASSDFDVFANNTDDWTIDFQVRITELDDYLLLIAQTADIYTGNWWRMYKHPGGAISADILINDSEYVLQMTTAGILTVDTFCHAALITIGNGSDRDIGIYINGVQLGYANVSTSQNFGLPLRIGYSMIPGVIGSLDEIRIQKSNIFGAAPVEGLTDTISVPTGAYTSDSGIITRNQSIIIV